MRGVGLWYTEVTAMPSRLHRQDTLECKCYCMRATGAAKKYIPVSIVDVLDEGLHGMTSILQLSPATSLWWICPLVG